MDFHLQPQLENAEEIRNILREHQVSYELPDGRKVETLLVYLPIEAGVSCHAEFFEKVKDGILYNFVFSCNEIEKKAGIKNDETAQAIFEKAIRKLSQHTAKGELGELILFTLLDVYFRAPKILSKISFKTSRKMPVYGADAVHGQFHNGQFKLYLGESKLYKDFKSAANDAASSIKTAKLKYEEEFDLLDSHMDFPNMSEDLESQLLGLLNPFIHSDVSDIIHSPCFIGFAEPELISSAASESDFLESYTELAGEYIEHFFSKVENQGMNIDEAALLMLPYSCVDDLVKEFISYIGIKK